MCVALLIMDFCTLEVLVLYLVVTKILTRLVQLMTVNLQLGMCLI